ncbi:hypothetical protein GQX74_009533 [Glossina fuscipes]|nr:hypothetical protein GQX74_009533 [Glossina fuscipes]
MHFIKTCWSLISRIIASRTIDFLHFWRIYVTTKNAKEEICKVQVEQATSQLLPDTFQASHETSTTLIRNQSLIVMKISELQHSVQELWKKFTEYRLSMEAQKSYEKEEKLVADFGPLLQMSKA